MNTNTVLKQIKNEAITLENAFTTSFLPFDEAGIRCISTKNGSEIHNLYCKAHQVYDIKINPNLDYYLTLNSLRSWNRQSSNVLSINSFYVDIDYRTKNMTKEQCLSFLYQVLQDENIFEPTLIMDSGRGLWLFWELEPIIVNSSKIVNLWNQIQSDLITKLSVLGADSAVKSVTNLVRFPGSYNQKNHVKTSLISYNENAVYEMRDFQTEISTYKPKQQTKTGSVSIMRNEYHLNILRVSDIEKLFELRDYDIQGMRNIMLFIYRNMLNMANDNNAESKVETMNARLTSPVSVRELKSLNKENKNYLFKNITLVDRLDISSDEMIFLKTIITKDECKRRKRVANNKRYASVKQANKELKNQRDTQIKELHERGVKVSEIAKQVGVHRNTVRNVLKK